MLGVQAVHYTRMQSQVGPLLLAASENGLRYVQFHAAKLPRRLQGEVWIELKDVLRFYEEQLRAYFAGELRVFNCKLDLQGTPFQVRCWETLCRIPYGTTCSYADLAKMVGNPSAFRAVAQATRHNPVAIVVPSHRVIDASGALKGNGAVVTIRERLLRLEGLTVKRASRLSPINS